MESVVANAMKLEFSGRNALVTLSLALGTEQFGTESMTLEVTVVGAPDLTPKQITKAALNRARAIISAADPS